MGLKFSNFGKAIIASAPIGTTGLSFTVEAGKGLLFPVLAAGDYFYAILKNASGNREVVKIEARSVDSMTIAPGGRGLDGTTARTWAAGDYLVAGLTNIGLQESLSNENLIALGKVLSGADKLPYFTGSGAAGVTGFSAAARDLLDDADAAAMRVTLGVATPAEITNSLIPSTTVMLFYQPSAPAGWTQVTGLTGGYALRMVSGVGGNAVSGLEFTTAFKSQAVNGVNSATTLQESQMPQHSHSYVDNSNSGSVSTGGSWINSVGNIVTKTSGITGGGGSHNHPFTGTPINLAVQYIDVILASKN